MNVLLRQSGEKSFRQDLSFLFSGGIIGFEQCPRFLLVEDEVYDPFRWLVSLDRPGLRFPLLNPLTVMPEFTRELPAHLVERLFSSDHSIDIFCIATIDGETRKVTINLKSPVIIDYRDRLGEQVILPSEDLPVAYPLM